MDNNDVNNVHQNLAASSETVKTEQVEVHPEDGVAVEDVADASKVKTETAEPIVEDPKALERFFDIQFKELQAAIYAMRAMTSSPWQPSEGPPKPFPWRLEDVPEHRLKALFYRINLDPEEWPSPVDPNEKKQQIAALSPTQRNRALVYDFSVARLKVETTLAKEFNADDYVGDHHSSELSNEVIENDPNKLTILVTKKGYECYDLKYFGSFAKKHRIMTESGPIKEGMTQVVSLMPEEVKSLALRGLAKIIEFTPERKETPDSFLYYVPLFINPFNIDYAAFLSARGEKQNLLMLEANGDATLIGKAKNFDFELTKEDIQKHFLFVAQKRRFTQKPAIVNDYVVEREFLEVCSTCPKFQDRSLVYDDLWMRGFMITRGVKFGCDFLVYDGTPSEVHSDFMCYVATSTQTFSAEWYRTQTRLARSVKKEVLIAVVWPDFSITYTRHSNWDENPSGLGRNKRIHAPRVNSNQPTSSLDALSNQLIRLIGEGAPGVSSAIINGLYPSTLTLPTFPWLPSSSAEPAPKRSRLLEAPVEGEKSAETGTPMPEK